MLWWDYKVKIIVIKKDIKSIVGALFEQNSSLSSHILIGFVHLLDKSEQLMKKSLNGKYTNIIIEVTILGFGGTYLMG